MTDAYSFIIVLERCKTLGYSVTDVDIHILFFSPPPRRAAAHGGGAAAASAEGIIYTIFSHCFSGSLSFHIIAQIFCIAHKHSSLPTTPSPQNHSPPHYMAFIIRTADFAVLFSSRQGLRTTPPPARCQLASNFATTTTIISREGCVHAAHFLPASNRVEI